VSQSTASSDTSGDSQATLSGTTTSTSDSATTVDSSGESTQGVSASETSTGPGSTSTSTGTDTGSESSTGEPPCEPGGMGEEFSFLWIANTDQGSVSKINTNTMVEVARYYTDPVQSGAASPSRTSVSLDGRFMVVSNRDTGSIITKIAAKHQRLPRQEQRRRHPDLEGQGPAAPLHRGGVHPVDHQADDQ
jgi:hypothetical protein